MPDAGQAEAAPPPDTQEARVDPVPRFSPMPDLVVRVDRLGDRIAAVGLMPRNHIGGMQSALRASSTT